MTLLIVVVLLLVLWVLASMPPPPIPPDRARPRAPQRLAGGFVLEVVKGPDQGLRCVLVGPEIVIGSGPGPGPGPALLSVWLQDPSVSAQQCRLQWAESMRAYGIVAMSGAVTVVHRGSEQVVLDEVNQILLQPGDTIVMGQTTMRLST